MYRCSFGVGRGLGKGGVGKRAKATVLSPPPRHSDVFVQRHCARRPSVAGAPLGRSGPPCAAAAGARGGRRKRFSVRGFKGRAGPVAVRRLLQPWYRFSVRGRPVHSTGSMRKQGGFAEPVAGATFRPRRFRLAPDRPGSSPRLSTAQTARAGPQPRKSASRATGRGTSTSRRAGGCRGGPAGWPVRPASGACRAGRPTPCRARRGRRCG